MDEAALYATFRAESPGGPELADREVHVWAVPLGGEGEGVAALLSAAEQEKASRFRVADHRRRYAITHGALRAILGGYLAADPMAIAFEGGERGKPRLRDGGLHFNLSHSAQLTLIALGPSELGVDLEKLRHLESLRDIARRHFSAREIAALEATAESERLLAFYRCWTRKEAYVKAIGTGLAAALDVFDVGLGAEPALLGIRVDGEDPAAWTLFDVSPAPDYVGALAVRARGLRLRTFRLAGL